MSKDALKIAIIGGGSTSTPEIIEGFLNRLDELPESYNRYLINGIRRELGFGAVPVRLNLRNQKNPYGDKKR